MSKIHFLRLFAVSEEDQGSVPQFFFSPMNDTEVSR